MCVKCMMNEIKEGFTWELKESMQTIKNMQIYQKIHHSKSKLQLVLSHAQSNAIQ